MVCPLPHSPITKKSGEKNLCGVDPECVSGLSLSPPPPSTVTSNADDDRMDSQTDERIREGTDSGQGEKGFESANHDLDIKLLKGWMNQHQNIELFEPY